MSMRSDVELGLQELHALIMKQQDALLEQGKAIQRFERMVRAHFDVAKENVTVPVAAGRGQLRAMPPELARVKTDA